MKTLFFICFLFLCGLTACTEGERQTLDMKNESRHLLENLDKLHPKDSSKHPVIDSLSSHKDTMPSR